MDINDRPTLKMIDLLLLWVGLFGVWPLADPGHDLSTVPSLLDVILHVTAWLVLCARWTIVRRVQR